MNASPAPRRHFIFTQTSIRRLQLVAIASATAAIALLFAGRATAQATAQDDAAKSVYTNGWFAGTNGGFGFGPWTLANSANGGGNFSGFLIEGNVNEISVSNKSFLMYANGASGNYAVAYRAFSNSLTVGKVFTVKLKTTGITSGGVMGFSLRTGTNFTQANDFTTLTANARFSFYFIGGNNGYTIYDGNLSSVYPEIPFTVNGLTLEFAIRTADTYRFSVKNGAGTVTLATFDDQPLQGTGSIDSLACYNLQTGGNENTYFNQFSVVPTSLVPPEITGVQPANGAFYQPTNTLITFNALSAFSGIATNTNSIKVSLNGTNVPGTNFSFVGSSTNWAVTAAPALVPNTTYNVLITVTDLSGNSATNTFSFNTWSANDLFIEAEDYNYGSGRFANPFAYPYGQYGGLPGSNTIDYLEYGDPTNATGFANNYREADPIWLEVSGDSADHANLAANSTTNYAMGFIQTGEWQNYTRRVTNGAYNVYARMSGGAVTPVMLMERAASATATNTIQPRAALGTFVGTALFNTPSNYIFVPLKDFFSQPVVVRFSTNAPTTNTFRLTSLSADGSYNLDYLLFVPVAVANTNTQRPYISRGYPIQGDYVEPDHDIDFTVANRDTRVTNIQLFVNGVNVSSSLVLNSNAAGIQANYQPIFPNVYPPGTNTTVSVVFTDSTGGTQTNGWQFNTYGMAIIPTAYALNTNSAGSVGFGLRTVKYTNDFPTTVTPQPASSAWAEALLATNVVYTNGSGTLPPELSGLYNETGVLNYNQVVGFGGNAGIFTNDTLFPNIPPSVNNYYTNDPNNFALAATTYLALSPGIYKFAVRSEDGFGLSFGTSASPTNLLAEYQGSRNDQSASEFELIVQTNGLYPMRLLQYCGIGFANLEFYSINRTNGQAILINDPNNANSIKAYRTVNSGSPSTNANLAALALTPASVLTPTFAAGTLSYTATETYGSSPLTVTPTSADATATIQVNINGGAFSPVTSGNPSGGLALNANPGIVNTVDVRVTAQDTVTVKDYIVSVTRQPSLTPATLTNSVSGATLALNWPLDHLGYRLLVQTNNLNKGVSSIPADWGTVTGSAATNTALITITNTLKNEFYKLVYP